MSGSTPRATDELIRAVESGNRPLLSRLIAEGADVNHVNKRGYSALMMAAEKGNAEIVTVLIGRGARVDQLTVVDSDCHCHTALFEATREKQTEVVRILLKNRADANQSAPGKSYTALHMAASNGALEIVSVLIEFGANVNLLSSFPGEYSALYAAARHANAQIVSKLIRAGADVNLLVKDSGETALMGAAMRPNYFVDSTDKPRLLRRQLETISLLIQAGANINAVADNGNTALLNAVRFSGGDQVRLLIAYGANVNQRTALGTPLMKAIETGDINKVRMLVLAGAERTDIPETLFQKYIHPIISPLQQLLKPHKELITVAFLKLKTNKESNLFKNDAFREYFNEWDDLRINMVSRIVSLLITLECEDLAFSNLFAPFLPHANMETLDRFGIVLSFLTSPFANRTNIFEGMSKDELVGFIKATFRSTIIMGFSRETLHSFVDSMYAVYSNLIADFGATQKGLRRIADVNIGTVYQFRHGEFGIHSKFAENLNKILI